jgi:ubiquinone/menaquinone biosynthesis C-methylase UbiE/biotin operon repressor
MPSILKTLRAAADPTRLRILLLLEEEELSVAELQETLTLGQSTISSHLAQLRQAGLVEDRRAGKSSLYRLVVGAGDGVLTAMLALADKEIPEAATDQAAMRRVVKKRQERMRTFFDAMAGRLGKDYVPGKSWKSIVVALMRLLPPMTVADLGSGDGNFSLLLATRAKRVIAVDGSEKMLEVGRDQAARNGIDNVEFLQGDMEELPIESGSVELAFFSQSLHHALHPARALAEAHRVLQPGGRVVVLDLAKHRFEEAREMYADEWLGFGEAELEQMLTDAGFSNPEVAIVDRDPDAPQFQTLLAIAVKAS